MRPNQISRGLCAAASAALLFIAAASGSEALASTRGPQTLAIDAVHGEFASVADRTKFQKALAGALGSDVHFVNPDDDVLGGDGEASDQFGVSVALSGDTALVGAHLDVNQSGRGGAYVFIRVGQDWIQQAKLVPDADLYAQHFGAAVALNVDTAVVGSPGETVAGASTGAAYVFVRSTGEWSKRARLSSADEPDADNFGAAVAIEFDTVVVGAPYSRNGKDVAIGAAYVFADLGSGWQQQACLRASDGAADDLFGGAVAVSGNSIVVGSRSHDTPMYPHAGAAYVFVRDGTSWTEQARLEASDGQFADLLGASVAIDGNTVVLGATRGGSSQEADAGAAYVFVRDGVSWLEEAKLLAADPSHNASFGNSVAVQGDRAVVGASLDNTGGPGHAGSAYVFQRVNTNWIQQSKLTVNTAFPTQRLGTSVAMSNGTILVGDPMHRTVAGDAAGSAFVFIDGAGSWSQQVELTAGDGATDDRFGASVAISVDSAVVGVPGDDHDMSTNAGAVYVFVRNDDLWTLQAKLVANDAAAADAFGAAVAIAADIVLVGATGDDSPPVFGHGSVYVFARSGDVWLQQAKLVAGDFSFDDEFGSALAFSNDTALIAAPDKTTIAGPAAGAVYAFVRSGAIWTEQSKMLAAQGDNGARFGWSVAIDGDVALIGAPFDDSPLGLSAGSAYVFERDGVAWTQRFRFLDSEASLGDHVGAGVALSGDTAVITAPGDDSETEQNTGAAHVLVRNGMQWDSQAKLIPNEGAWLDHFTGPVALAGDVVVLGGQSSISPGSTGEAAFVFRRLGGLWRQQSILFADDAAYADQFGSSVALDGDTALVGAPADDSASTGNPDVGSVHIFNEVIGIFGDGFE